MFHGSSVNLFKSNLQIVKPRGRINSCIVVGKDTLYLYGGMMEIKDQEITLDDLYALNLSKLDEWKCIIPVCICFIDLMLSINVSCFAIVFRPIVLESFCICFRRPVEKMAPNLYRNFILPHYVLALRNRV